MSNPAPDVLAPFGLTVETVDRPQALWVDRPRFGWRIPPTASPQAAYEIEIEDGSGRVASSGRVESDECAGIELPSLVLASRTAYTWRVRVWDARGRIGPWSASSFETSLLDPWDWRAGWVEPAQEPVTREADLPGLGMRQTREELREVLGPPEKRLHPAPLLRQVFTVERRPDRGRLYITAHGVYDVWLNGRPVSDDVLSPGHDAHPARLSVFTYDLTALLVAGRNVLTLMLGDGWWAGRVSVMGHSGNYGDRLSAIWQVEGDGVPLAVSGRDVRSSFGGIRYSDVFIGERFDARAVQRGWRDLEFDDSGWSLVAALGGSVAGLVPFIGEPMRRVAEFPAAAILSTPSGETVIDAGRTLTGRLRVRATGRPGVTIRFEHSETLAPDGAFRVNTAGQNRDMTDVWILAGEGVEEFEPTFSLRGFRYARVEGHSGIRPEDVTVVEIASDLRQTGVFETDDERINRLHRNIVATQRANLVSIPVDDTMREGQGWTGDIQVFGPSAINNMHMKPFLERWLANVRAEQFGDGQIPPIVPNLPWYQRLATSSFGHDSAAGWSDVISILPLALYERYGDRRILEENFPAMRRWVDYCARTAARLPARLTATDLDIESRARQALLWNTEIGFGDWLRPSADEANPRRGKADLVDRQVGAEIMASLYSLESLANLSRTAKILGDDEIAKLADARRHAVRRAFRGEYWRNGRLLSHTQGLYVLALAFDALSEAERADAGRHLVDLIAEADTHLDTGIMSTAHVLDVLVGLGEADLAYRVLLQESPPSWLSQVAGGATSVWESWYGVTPAAPGTSVVHYAFASVDDWLYRHVAGIQAVEPGYRRLRIAPDLSAPFGLVRAAVETPQGRVSVEVRKDAVNATIVVEIPGNVTAELIAPGRPPEPLDPGTNLRRVALASPV